MASDASPQTDQQKPGAGGWRTFTRYELFGCSWCEHTQEMREWLEFRGEDFVEFDVEQDDRARARMLQLSGGQRTVPVLVEDGRVVQVGWQGRGCVVGNIAGDRVGGPVGGGR